MFRAEQTGQPAGDVTLSPEGGGPRTVVNGSGLDLNDAWVVEVQQPDEGRQAVSLGAIAAGAKVPSGRRGGQARGPASARTRSTPAPSWSAPSRAVAARPEEVGELRLIAWSARPLPGQTIDPPVDRQRGFTLVVAHLQPRPAARPGLAPLQHPGPRPRAAAEPPIPPPVPNMMPGMARGRRPSGARPAGAIPEASADGRRPVAAMPVADAPPATPAADARRHPPRRPEPEPNAPETPSMIEVSHFTKRYGDFVAVDDLNLSIGNGEVFGFIGPNGAGKSTTIRFLATLLRPTSGEGRVAGQSVVNDPMAVRRVIGYMPDDFGVYDGMKVWEFLDFFAVAYEIPRSYRKKIIGQVLELLDLTHKRDDYVNGLSKGMKQRLCLAKTLVHDPPVLILDEPASGLDPRARLEMKALLNELRGMGKTILVSSHILSELADFCTSIGIIERGKLLAAGSIAEITRQFRQHRVLKVRVLDDSADRAAVDPPRRGQRQDGRDARPHPHRRVPRAGRGPGAAARALDIVGRRRAFVRGGGVELEEVFMMITKGIVN